MGKDYKSKEDFLAGIEEDINDRGFGDHEAAYCLEEASEWLNFKEMNELRNMIVFRLLRHEFPNFADAYLRLFVEPTLDDRS